MSQGLAALEAWLVQDKRRSKKPHPKRDHMTIPANEKQAALVQTAPRSTGHRGAWLLLTLGVVIGLGGLSLELKLPPRALPVIDAPMVTHPLAFAARAPGQLDAIVSRVAPWLSNEMRGGIVDAVVLEGTRSGYDPLFLLAVMGVESGWHVAAQSEKGAKGLLQLEPGTFKWIAAREHDIGEGAKKIGVDPVLDVRLAVRYLTWLEGNFKSRDTALMAYNAGPAKMRRMLQKNDVPDSVKEYPQRVRKEYEHLLTLDKAPVMPDLTGALARD
jgi:hypothetical protein